jgi:hypothetical protein
VLDDLVIELDPPPNRRSKCGGEKERHLTEAAVMLAYGMHLLRTVPGLTRIDLHPDGEHAKRFEIAQWLSARGFSLKESHGSTSWCGTYVRDDQVIVVTSVPGKGDVVAASSGGGIVAECKGGIVNTRHAGQVSRLRKGLCEAVGLLMDTEQTGRQIAVVPYTETTNRLAQRMAPRAGKAGITIALVRENGEVMDVDCAQ